MSIVDLLDLFADPQKLKELTLAQKMTASLITTILGMGITFLALVLLQFTITCMAAISISAGKKKRRPGQPVTTAPEQQLPSEHETDQEIIAAITVSLAVMLERSTDSLVIRNIRKVEDSSPAWSRAGLAEQMNRNI